MEREAPFRRKVANSLWAELPASLAVIAVGIGVILVTEPGESRFWILLPALLVTYVIFDRRTRRWVDRHRTGARTGPDDDPGRSA